ncbi:hypothetical protein Enr10x_60490 [Gimesia panareensis]|uniref:Uncharacterized protein n=1 Tax=Gimesia panareensis TaxID=2527978 RepID=A0A517QGC2_9PLAN|nr:hypothetical protein [Gimesia panareensis]QDT30681.1 hypothetical protein Enr10x_60490 [Gimesia panareensis]
MRSIVEHAHTPALHTRQQNTVMAALLELIMIFLLGLCEALTPLVLALLELLAVCLEFVFLALIKGPSAASEQFQKRKEEHAERKRQQDEKKRAVQAARANEPPPISGHQYFILGFLALFIVIGISIAWTVKDRIQQQRIAETRAQVKQLANNFAGQIRDREIEDPVSHRLRDRDAWQQPIELRVDKELLSSEVVVRSWGPDRKPGSSDDIVTKHTIRVPAKEVGGELAKRGMKAVRNRIAGWLPGGDKEQQSKETDNVEE